MSFHIECSLCTAVVLDVEDCMACDVQCWELLYSVSFRVECSLCTAVVLDVVDCIASDVQCGEL